MVNAKPEDDEEQNEVVAPVVDLSTPQRPIPDIEILPDRSDDELEIGSGLTLRFDKLYSDETYEELEVLRQTPNRRSVRQGLPLKFGPEMTAGVVIGLLLATFVLLMVAGVRNEPTAVIEEPVAPAVAPPAEDSPDQAPAVDIGEAVTLERE